MREAVVLGCGPAGLLAAHAANMAGFNVRIISIKEKSDIVGAQFMHRAIPGLEVPEQECQIMKLGDREGYAKKVYGDASTPCSWDTYPTGKFPCWSMTAMYDLLWSIWEDSIFDMRVDHQLLDEIERGPAELLISSIPAPYLCSHDEHWFESVAAKIEVRTHTCDIPGHDKNVILYNGLDQEQWHRMSQFNGFVFLEYNGSTNIVLPLGDVYTVQKPQRTNCDCRRQWRRVGRYGKWTRGVLVHHAYEEVSRALRSVS